MSFPVGCINGHTRVLILLGNINLDSDSFRDSGSHVELLASDFQSCIHLWMCRQEPWLTRLLIRRSLECVVLDIVSSFDHAWTGRLESFIIVVTLNFVSTIGACSEEKIVDNLL